MKVELLEPAIEIESSSLYEGKILVDGKQIEYRWYEDNNDVELYILTEDVWSVKDADYKFNELRNYILEVGGPTML